MCPSFSVKVLEEFLSRKVSGFNYCSTLLIPIIFQQYTNRLKCYIDYLPYKISFSIKPFGFGSKQQQEKLHCTHRTFGGMYVLVPDTLGLPTYIFTTIRYSFTCQLQHELASSGSNARRIYFFPESSSLLSFPARLLLYLARQRKDATSILSLYKRISSIWNMSFNWIMS